MGGFGLVGLLGLDHLDFVGGLSLDWFGLVDGLDPLGLGLGVIGGPGLIDGLECVIGRFGVIGWRVYVLRVGALLLSVSLQQPLDVFDFLVHCRLEVHHDKGEERGEGVGFEAGCFACAGFEAAFVAGGPQRRLDGVALVHDLGVVGCAVRGTLERRQVFDGDGAVISDLSAFIGSTDPSTHRILAAGDLNMIYGATEDNPLALPARDRTVTDRMAALGLEFLGPQHPAGRRANPTPQGLPPDTRNVPTFHSARRTPETAQNQLDYVFASRGFHRGVKVRAMNGVEEWGPSDHCRLLIETSS